MKKLNLLILMFFLFPLILFGPEVTLGETGKETETKKETGADVLLKNVDLENNTEVEAATDISGQRASEGLTLTDAFLIEFFTSWKTHQGLSYDINRWSMDILKHRFKQAAHLWTVVDKQAPRDFRIQIKMARLYLMWKLDLPQTFIDLLLESIGDEKLKNSKLMAALDQVISEHAPQWFMEKAPLLTTQQKKMLFKVDASKNALLSTVKLWALFRSGEKAIPFLKALPASHSFKIPLAQTVVLDLARQNRLGEAGKIMKQEVEPAIHHKNDPKVLSLYYLTLGRLLYQAGALEAAEVFYRKIPNSVPEFLNARTELLWVLLRKGDIADLRGELTSLGMGVFSDKFLPEIYLVRSISNLKLCQYDLVEKDFKDFIEINRKWANEISRALKSKNPPTPWRGDFFIDLAKKSLAQKEKEIETLERLGKESIKATLPAVGIQAHWAHAKVRVQLSLEDAKKHLLKEYRRFWKNQELVLYEIIRKMKFVKVETMTQIHTAAKKGDLYNKTGGDQVSTVQASQSTPDSADRLSFPFDGVLWPDELFKMQSVARNYCLNLNKIKEKR